MACIEARGLRKAFGATVALDGIDLSVEEGRILGLIGPNGAGKSTALNAILGLTAHQGELRVLGRDPWNERDRLMTDVCFIADVAVLPRWLRVSQALDYVAGVHPRFDRVKAEAFLAKTDIKRASKVRQLSKGMVTQLHLALIMAIDARLLVLDEPTLGLDLLYRNQFYDTLLNDYFDRSRTIVVTTHQVEEIQHILTDLVFIDRGRIVLSTSMEDFEQRYLEVMVNPERLDAARALRPIHERQVFGRGLLLFDSVDRGQLAALGEVRAPSIADLFVAVIGGPSQEVKRAAGRGSRRMTTPSDAMPASPPGPRPVGPKASRPTRPFYWSVRRELWENRSLHVAPAAVAALVLFGFLISAHHTPHWRHGAQTADPSQLLALPYYFAAFAIFLTGFIVAFFYCLGALYDERRDRGILFWKSLPVSNLTTVLAKASVPLLVLPVILFVVTLATQLAMLLLSASWAAARGQGSATAWSLPWVHMTLGLLYALVAASLWLAPIWAWLLLVSGWARRAPFLWAVLPPLALCLVEKISFDTGWLAGLLRYRLFGWLDEAFVGEANGEASVDPLTRIDLAGYLTTPGLWAGLAVAAAFLAAAVWQRRRREPI